MNTWDDSSMARLVDAFGWPAVLAVMAVGPAAGILAMLRLRGMS